MKFNIDLTEIIEIKGAITNEFTKTTKVGLYLAIARQAESRSYPEIVSRFVDLSEKIKEVLEFMLDWKANLHKRNTAIKAEELWKIS